MGALRQPLASADCLNAVCPCACTGRVGQAATGSLAKQGLRASGAQAALLRGAMGGRGLAGTGRHACGAERCGRQWRQSQRLAALLRTLCTIMTVRIEEAGACLLLGLPWRAQCQQLLDSILFRLVTPAPDSVVSYEKIDAARPGQIVTVVDFLIAAECPVAEDLGRRLPHWTQSRVFS